MENKPEQWKAARVAWAERKLGRTVAAREEALRALTVEAEQAEVAAVGRAPVRLRYRGRMAWMVKAGHDGRIWDVLESGADYATLTLDGLRDRGII